MAPSLIEIRFHEILAGEVNLRTRSEVIMKNESIREKLSAIFRRPGKHASLILLPALLFGSLTISKSVFAGGTNTGAATGTASLAPEAVNEAQKQLVQNGYWTVLSDATPEERTRYSLL